MTSTIEELKKTNPPEILSMQLLLNMLLHLNGTHF
jgi:hypothetical protein